MNRDQIQQQAVAKWMETKKGTILLATAFGKTRVGRMVYDMIKPESCLIVTSKIPLVAQWKEEMGDRVCDIMCINSAYKIGGKYDLLIVDEVHKTLSPVFRKLYSNVQYLDILCLSATLPHNVEYKEYLESISPVVYEKGIEEGIKVSALSPYIMYNVKVPMKESLYKYRVFNNMFIKAQMELSTLMKENKIGKKSIFDVAKENKDSTNIYSSASKKYWNGMTMRKLVVYNAIEKIKVGEKIIKMFPEKKWIVFIKSIKSATIFAQSVNGKVYHCGLNRGEREKILQDFSENKFKVLVAVEALNEGLNIPDIDAGMCISGVSSKIVGVQTLGRVIRYLPNKQSMFINLYLKDTIEQSWLENKTEKLNPIWIENYTKLSHAK